MQTILLTGANGHLGSRLISRLVGKYKVLAVVRSDHASQSLGKVVGELDNLTIEIVDYNDEATLIETIHGCDHLYILLVLLKRGKIIHMEMLIRGHLVF